MEPQKRQVWTDRSSVSLQPPWTKVIGAPDFQIHTKIILCTFITRFLMPHKSVFSFMQTMCLQAAQGFNICPGTSARQIPLYHHVFILIRRIARVGNMAPRVYYMTQIIYKFSISTVFLCCKVSRQNSYKNKQDGHTNKVCPCLALTFSVQCSSAHSVKIKPAGHG